MRIFVLGYPGAMGGANTECFHTVALWRTAGWDVHLIPTWGRDDYWQARLDSIGCTTHHVGPPPTANLSAVPGLAGSIVVALCNARALEVLGSLRALGCRLVWVNCMTFLFDHERRAFAEHGPAEAFVFQSEFQRSMLEGELLRLGYTPDCGHLIRGAFDVKKFPYAPRPHEPNTEFVIGRLARPDADKWHRDTWPLLGVVPYAGRCALVMGWSAKLQEKLGPPPAWATCLKPQEISAREFLGRCHAMLPLNGGARENWPRVGLEAMAAGVPVVAPRAWGWTEMIEHGQTGFLGESVEELVYYTASLAYDESRRLEMAAAARARVEKLADPETILAGWRKLFASVETAR